MMSECKVCNKEPSKYKCSNCTLPYCSISCFKTHKEVPCQKIEDQKYEDKSGHKKIQYFTTIDTVDQEKLEELRNSESLKALLYNPHLRQLLREVDSAPNARRAMDAAMMEPLFLEFADEALKIVEPVEGEVNNGD